MNGDNNNDANGAGAVYLFQRSGDSWNQQAYIKASNAGANDYFGRSVTLNNEVLVIGSDLEDSAATGINGDENSNAQTNSVAAYIIEIE